VTQSANRTRLVKPALLACLLITGLLFGRAALAQETPAPEATPAPIEGPVTPAPLPTPTSAASPTAAPGPLQANPATLQSNIGVPKVATIGGASGALTATVDPKIATVSVSGSTVTIDPTMNGRATVHIIDQSGASIDIFLRVAPNAATISKYVTVKLTGDLDPDYVAKETTLQVRQAANANPGTTINLGLITPPPNPFPVGSAYSIGVPITVLGGDQYLDVSDVMGVTVQHVAAQPFSPTILYYSDDPERIVNDGVLFRGTVTPTTPVRLYDYHENGNDPRRLVVVLSTSSTSPTSVQMIESFAGPNIDVMTVGHTASKNFLIQKPHNEGVVIDLNNGAPFFRRDVSMLMQQGVADIADFQILQGGPVTITVLAASPNVPATTLLAGPQAPGDGKGRHGVFALGAYGGERIDYTVGTQDTFVTIGDRDQTVPKATAADPGADFGDYGVMFNLTLIAHNPDDTPQTVYIYEAPRGGPVRASYLLDNSVVPTELGCATSPPTATSPPRRYLIGQFDVAPHGAQAHVVRFMTDGGSNYPLEIGLTSTPPEPQTPPIFGPDGCFPKPSAALRTSP